MPELEQVDGEGLGCTTLHQAPHHIVGFLEMYERIDLEDHRIVILERMSSPMVYLDNWALNDFALDKTLQDKFIDTINSTGGMLRVSATNIAEFGSQTDRAQVKSIIDMIDRVNDIGLINVDPGKVIRRENLLISDPSLISDTGNPSAELGLVTIHLMAQNYPETWKVSEIISIAVNDLPDRNLSNGNQRFSAKMQNLLEKARNDQTYLEKASKRFKGNKISGPKFQRPTRELFEMAFDFVIRNQNMKMTHFGEWNDLFHVIVPVSCCDIVLIDKRWVTFISQTGFGQPDIAKVFSKKSIDGFFLAIENWE